MSTAVGVGTALERVRDRVRAAAIRAGRVPQEVHLVGVTKGVPPDRVAEAAAAGLTDVGENRVQELRRKQQALEGVRLRWHMVGTLQRNKVRDVVGRAALIHSVDSLGLGEAIADRARSERLVQSVLLQVNTSGEATKHGADPGAAEALAARIAGLGGIRLLGLMTIGPAGWSEGARTSFRLLAELRRRVLWSVPDATELSMGMSEDFEIAVEEGATIVRVGTAIFGPRPG